MSEQVIYDFMGRRRLAAIGSIVLLIVAIGSLATKGLVLGLDFTGGTQIEVAYPQAAELSVVRSSLEQNGFKNPVVVHFGTESEILIRLQGQPEAGLSDQVMTVLRVANPAVELRRIEFVGPQIGEELRDDGGLGMLAALAVVMLYVAIRFQYKFSIAAVCALIHDVIITLGFFSLFNVEFDLTVLAAVLAVIGYSLNDTIVVSDRIRENFRLLREVDALGVINESLTQTLGRTIITSLTTLLVLLALFFIGGELIHNFSIALIVGVMVGTYSSIYVAANILLAMDISREDLLPTEKEGVEFDGLP
jgi:preprotein translocase subunit SecF